MNDKQEFINELINKMNTNNLNNVKDYYRLCEMILKEEYQNISNEDQKYLFDKIVGRLQK